MDDIFARSETPLRSSTELASFERMDLSGRALINLSAKVFVPDKSDALECCGEQLAICQHLIFPHLKELYLSHNRLTADCLTDTICGTTMPQLEKLDLRNNNLSRLPDSICSINNLTHLYVDNELYKEDIFSRPAALDNEDSQNLDALIANLITELPSNFCHLTSLIHLEICNVNLCSLIGRFGDLINLEYLDISHNELDCLPESFCHLQSLTTFKAVNNELLALPNNFGNLKKLAFLNLNDNSLSELPHTFDDLSSLRHLHLYGNEISWLSPKTVFLLSGLESLDLKMNLISFDEVMGAVETRPEMSLTADSDWKEKMASLLHGCGMISLGSPSFNTTTDYTPKSPSPELPCRAYDADESILKECGLASENDVEIFCDAEDDPTSYEYLPPECGLFDLFVDSRSNVALREKTSSQNIDLPLEVNYQPGKFDISDSGSSDSLGSSTESNKWPDLALTSHNGSSQKESEQFVPLRDHIDVKWRIWHDRERRLSFERAELALMIEQGYFDDPGE